MASSSNEVFTRKRGFFLPYDPATVRELLTAGYEFSSLSEAPIAEDVYFSRKDDQAIVFTAGNRLVTHWNITFQLEPSAGGTKGTLSVDRPYDEVKKWQGNVLKIIGNAYQRLSSASATFTAWGLNDQFP